MAQVDSFRSGFVALAGLPNAGKSTLLNALLGAKISIVSPMPQTTRNRIVGVHTTDDAQLVLVDTPGLGREREELGRRMIKGARAAIDDADVAVWLSDATGDLPAGDKTAALLREADKPVVLALNKVDRVRPKERLLPLIERWAEVPNVQAVVPISALKAQGLEALVTEVAARLPDGPLLFPRETLTDRPERFLAAELVRERVLHLTRQEVPHAVAVQVLSWQEVQRGVRIEAVVHVEKASQRGILVGKGGTMIKRIGQEARAEIGQLLGSEVHLALRVAVSEGWRGDPRALSELGYDE